MPIAGSLPEIIETAVIPKAIQGEPMIKQLLSIFFIYVCTAAAWGILGATVLNRTYSSGSSNGERVEQLWGTSQNQCAPAFYYETKRQVKQDSIKDGKTVTEVVTETERHIGDKFCRYRFSGRDYFFIGSAFFSFHLLLAYLVDHMSVDWAFAISSVVSIFLVVSYMRLVVSSKFAFIEVGISQLIYLILFSYTFFFEQYTGLAITILCVLTLFVMMQFTGRIDWSDVFRKASARNQAPAPGSGA